MKCVPVHHGIPAVLHRDEPWLHRHSENGAYRYNFLPRGRGVGGWGVGGGSYTRKVIYF